jgi:intron-binding protein aquarius
MLQRRIDLNNEVLKIANSIEVYSFQEYTCEHAINLYTYHIKQRIENFKNNVPSLNSLSPIKEIFPFSNYFNYLFTNDLQENINKCFEMIKLIEDIFDELKELRVFELLRNNFERGNYLVSKQSKIIAMTCTYAALKRRELIKLDFQYDNIIIEEAAQILEVETFIPMLLQNCNGKESKLKRIVLIGDNNQLPPIIKNISFKMYSKLDQSMFVRLIRTGVPYISLDRQGRTRYLYKYIII